jgi:hypothetical protein
LYKEGFLLIDKEKIRLMSKLAIYEKNYGTIDEKINGYYKSDYVYLQNWWARISAAIAGFIIVGMFLLYKIFIEKVDIFDLDYKLYGIRIGIFILILIVFYSFLSSYVYNKRYEESQKRIKNYLEMLKQLDEHKSLEQEEVYKEDYGSNLSNPGDNNSFL